MTRLPDWPPVDLAHVRSAWHRSTKVALLSIICPRLRPPLRVGRWGDAAADASSSASGPF
eukprot:scaffold206682_cov31-Tisochrysis_lutea.AAC.5